MARRAWLRRTRDDGGTTFRFQIFRRRGGGTGVTFREVRSNQDFSNFDSQNKVAGERKWLNFDQNFDQNKSLKKKCADQKKGLIKKKCREDLMLTAAAAGQAHGEARKISSHFVSWSGKPRPPARSRRSAAAQRDRGSERRARPTHLPTSRAGGTGSLSVAHVAGRSGDVANL